ncbi:U5 small nuclear ribonucleoprotein TSSC4 [Anabrus simplex]|uniref:U5 small nuclear ribonucleoprotein TSSC4 n=1 Tax=Anabrus simplex TaxID=316456 RepID=UPI0035A2DF67
MSGFVEPKFFIKSGDMGFLNRQRDIFHLLNAAEKEKNERQSLEGTDSESAAICSPEHEVMDVCEPPVGMRPRKRLRAETKQFRGKESIFKRPEAPPPRFNVRNIPDYRRNPQKWTKYSLGDVSQEDMSEKSNTAAALSFLRELEARKSVEPMEEDHKSHIIFKPTKKVAVEDGISSSDAAKSSFRSTKLIMPEYVVGQEKKKAKKNVKKLPSENDKSSKSIKLSHLEEEEEDDVDE